MAKEKATSSTAEKDMSYDELKKEILNDFRIANESRETSLLGRREVLTGKAKFGIFGDGKELPQIALAKQFKNGDFRSGYYRDQTFMMAAGLLTIEAFFAQLYANPSIEHEPASGGRQMNGHYATRTLDENGQWTDLMAQKNVSADISPTAGQMPRLLGLAYASNFYRSNKDLHDKTQFSNKGNEVAFGTIGDASTSEGPFWETINAAGVLQVPMVLSVWDDGHGISVPKKYQTTKESISELLKGYQRTDELAGYEILKAKGWDYRELCMVYEKAVELARKQHIPVLIHVEEVTQPQGHSTSGSHERYKSKERLEWEAEYDCIVQFGKWIVKNGIATQEELDNISAEAKKTVREAKKSAWSAFIDPIKQELATATAYMDMMAREAKNGEGIAALSNGLKSAMDPLRKEVLETAKKALRLSRGEDISGKAQLINWIDEQNAINKGRYNSHLFSESDQCIANIEPIEAKFSDNPKKVDGRELLRENFDNILANHPEVLIFGEDAGKIGGVNQGLEGLQEKYGENRVFDTGIREATIIGQAIGLSMRGLRPIAEIQYLDYLLYALQVMSDDLATVQYRTKGGQKAPVIIRTRGHRLEGIWHSGSPMGMILHACRGIHVCVPRNMAQAAGMYNTLLASDEPGLVVESLNGYRLKETLPDNIGEYRVPLGTPEILKEGKDITLVCYGSMVRMVEKTAQDLLEVGIDAEVIDVQTLLPFDTEGLIAASVKKTNRVIFIDEDVEGGASSFMMQQVLEKHKAYFHLDSEPQTLTSKNHRPAYGSDGDYFSKPSLDDIYEAVYKMMREVNPTDFPNIYS